MVDEDVPKSFSTYYPNDPFYVPVKNTIVRVEILGIDQKFRNRNIYSFID